MYECTVGSIKIYVVGKNEEDAKQNIADHYKWNPEEITCREYKVKIWVISNAPTNI